MIFYLTYWFPKAYIGQIFGLFYFGASIAFIVGGPISGLLLKLRGLAGLEGWQWMFLLEGLLASIAGIWAFFYLDDKPVNARWLSVEERTTLTSAIALESRQKDSHQLGAALFSHRVLLLGLIYLLIQMSVYGIVFYLPTQVANLLSSAVGFVVGLVSAIPWICGLLTTYLIPKIAAQRNNHRVVAACTLVVSAVGIAISGTNQPAVGILALSIAVSSFLAVQPLFWTFPVTHLGDAAAAGGIALINSLGTLGGFIAPNVKNWADVTFRSSRAGLFLLALAALIGALLILVSLPRTSSHDEVGVITFH